MSSPGSKKPKALASLTPPTTVNLKPPVKVKTPVPPGFKSPLSGASTQARLQRAHDRAVDRSGHKVTAARRQEFGARMEAEAAKFRASPSTREVTTPFGKVTLSKFPTSDPAPKVTTQKANYQKSSVGHKYKELTPALFPPRKQGAKRQREADAEVAEELLSSMRDDGRPPLNKRHIDDGKQKMQPLCSRLLHRSLSLCAYQAQRRLFAGH